MNRHEFIKHVQSIAQVGSREEAERAIRATLETIRDRIVGDEAKDLASQLPSDWKKLQFAITSLKVQII